MSQPPLPPPPPPQPPPRHLPARIIKNGCKHVLGTLTVSSAEKLTETDLKGAKRLVTLSRHTVEEVYRDANVIAQTDVVLAVCKTSVDIKDRQLMFPGLPANSFITSVIKRTVVQTGVALVFWGEPLCEKKLLETCELVVSYCHIFFNPFVVEFQKLVTDAMTEFLQGIPYGRRVGETRMDSLQYDIYAFKVSHDHTLHQHVEAIKNPFDNTGMMWPVVRSSCGLLHACAAANSIMYRRLHRAFGRSARISNQSIMEAQKRVAKSPYFLWPALPTTVCARRMQYIMKVNQRLWLSTLQNADKRHKEGRKGVE